MNTADLDGIRRQLRAEMRVRRRHWSSLGRLDMAAEADHCLKVCEDVLDGQGLLFNTPPPQA